MTDHPGVCDAYAPPTGDPGNSGFCARCGMYDWKHTGAAQPGTCDASAPSVLGNPLGPCVLRHGHDGPAHQGASGVTWRSTADPAVEARAVVQAATRGQLHDAIRTLARADPAWWNDELRRYVRINHNGRFC